MRIPNKTSYLIFYGVIALFILLGIVAGIQTCQQAKPIEQKIQEKIDRETKTPTIIITAHDIATAKSIDSAETSRRLLNRRIDAATQPELQSWIRQHLQFPRTRYPGKEQPLTA